MVPESGTSLPLRECGLKFQVKSGEVKPDRVTPLAGVWIEIAYQLVCERHIVVTPLAGVWIEIIVSAAFVAATYGHSPCGSVD